LGVLKLAARVVEPKTQIKSTPPSSASNQAIFGMLLDRPSRLVGSRSVLPRKDEPAAGGRLGARL
jgi:hypothetical protein